MSGEGEARETWDLVHLWRGQSATSCMLSTCMFNFYYSRATFLTQRKRSIWDQCKKYEYWRPTTLNQRVQRPTSGPIHTFCKNFKWPQLCNASSDPVHVWLNGRHLGFDPTGNGAVRSAVPENPTLERFERRHFRLDQIRDGGGRRSRP